MSRPSRARASFPLAVFAVIVLALGACGPSDDTASDDTASGDASADPTEDTLLQPEHVVALDLEVGSSDPDVIEAVAELVQRRIDALGIERADVGWDGSSIQVVVADGDEAVLRAALEPQDGVEMRQVLVGSDEPMDAGVGGAALVVTDPTDGMSYGLGPVVLDARGIESATAQQGPSGEWAVNPVLTEDGIAGFNQAAVACFGAELSCPDQGGGRGAIAILVDGVLLSAPAIYVARFERDQITISGAFDEASARGLAAALSAGAAPATWTVRN